MSLKLRKTTSSGPNVPLRASEISSRLTPEMSSAIRRQEQISNSDYWKTGFSGLGLINSPGGRHRRPNYNTLGRVTIDHVFPGLFLPSAISTRHQKLRERVHLTPAIVFSRSHTALAPTISKTNESLVMSPRRISVPKSTSVQINNSLSSSDSPFSGLLTLSPAYKHYVDTYTDSDSASEDGETSDNEDIKQTGFALNAKNQDTVTQKNIKGQRSNSLPPVRYRTIEPWENKLKEIPVQHLTSPTTIIVTKVLSDNKTRPILKKNGSKDVLDNPRKNLLFRSNTLDSFHVPQQSKYTQTTNPRVPHRTTGDLPSPRHKEIIFQRPREYTVPLITVGQEPRPDSRSDSQKRSVTFNADHKIHEYVPHEPICS